MDDFDKYMAGLRARAQAGPQTHEENRSLPQAAKERPDFHQRKTEREGNSPFSGGWAGGGTWAGRTR